MQDSGKKEQSKQTMCRLPYSPLDRCTWPSTHARRMRWRSGTDDWGTSVREQTEQSIIDAVSSQSAAGWRSQFHSFNWWRSSDHTLPSLLVLICQRHNNECGNMITQLAGIISKVGCFFFLFIKKYAVKAAELSEKQQHWHSFKLDPASIC